MLNPRHFRERVVRPALEGLGLHSQSAENLLLGTAYQESRLRHLHQLHGGPALGLFQVEPATHEDLWRSYLAYRPGHAKRVRALATIGPAVDGPVPDYELASNLAYATAVARMIYYRRPEPLPGPNDVEGLAAYWKQHYNTPAGAGTVEEFERNYRELQVKEREALA